MKLWHRTIIKLDKFPVRDIRVPLRPHARALNCGEISGRQVYYLAKLIRDKKKIAVAIIY